MEQQIISYLNKKYHCNLSSNIYTKIDEWRDWWQGVHRPFHRYQISNGETLVYRDMFVLDMGKKVCEDWASILLNDKTTIVVDDKQASDFLQGETGTGGVLGSNNFWEQGNRLIERAWWSGTGAAVVRVNNLEVSPSGKPVLNPGCRIWINYISADCIIPISVDNGVITEVAFCSHRLKRGKKQLYLETHTLDTAGCYVITNECFTLENGSLEPIDLPGGMIPELKTGSPIPLFSIVSPNIENNLDPDEYPDNGLGLSILENAIDCLKGVDLAFNNLNCDFKLGAKKVFMSDELLQTDENGKHVTPDDTGQQLFAYVKGSLMEDAKPLFQEHNPSLRVADNTAGIQFELDCLSFKVGFGTKHYQFNSSTVVTATQYSGDRQDLIQNANKHYINVERFLLQLTRAILWAGKTCINPKIREDADVTINFDDSIIIDKETERARDKEDVRDGIMAKWQFREKWYGEDEETAKAAIAEIEGEGLDEDELLGFTELDGER